MTSKYNAVPPKKVSFYNRVKVIYIPPINKTLKSLLFYSTVDYEFFKMQANFISSFQDARLERRLKKILERIGSTDGQRDTITWKADTSAASNVISTPQQPAQGKQQLALAA